MHFLILNYQISDDLNINAIKNYIFLGLYRPSPPIILTTEKRQERFLDFQILLLQSATSVLLNSEL